MSYKIAALVLAAGLSRRAGPVNKLLVPLEGTPIVERALRPVIACGCDPVLVVTGHQAEQIEHALIGRPVSFVFNEAYTEGMASSLRAGISALPADVDAALIILGDMPHVRGETYKILMSAFDPEKGREIGVPVCDGKTGNPVLFGRRFFADLEALQGDKGGKLVLDKYREFVAEIDVDDPGIQLDYDTVQGLE